MIITPRESSFHNVSHSLQFQASCIPNLEERFLILIKNKGNMKTIITSFLLGLPRFLIAALMSFSVMAEKWALQRDKRSIQYLIRSCYDSQVMPSHRVKWEYSTQNMTVWCFTFYKTNRGLCPTCTHSLLTDRRHPWILLSLVSASLAALRPQPVHFFMLVLCFIDYWYSCQTM